ncbi:hypothetical protein SLA2020_460740 [Shorea laevis]
MECAGKGRGTRCIGPARRRCARCGAVSYCSVSHQISHWKDHKEECERLEQQMKRVDELNDFPFTFSEEATLRISEKEGSRCSFLNERGIHGVGMWKCECTCGAPSASLDYARFESNSWDLSNSLCPCRGPSYRLSKELRNWKEYYEWRCIPLHSPVALLLHWPLTIYYAIQVAGLSSLTSEISKLFIHYLGPEKELLQLAVFGELQALFPGVQVHIDLIGPAIPEHRDGEKIDIWNYAHCIESDCDCKSESKNISWSMDTGTTSGVMLRFHRGFYHDCFRDIVKDSLPHLVIAPNAGIAAFSSWLPTLELLKEINVPTVFTDYCEEACQLASHCINASTSCHLRLPIQLNPFRQPMVVEDSPLFLPCYSNCFLFAI